MSTPQQGESQPRSSGNVFTRKIGPLPMWGWMGIALALALVYYFYKKNSASAANTAQTNAASGNAPGGVDSSLVPQFINQEYVNTTPPAAPNVTVNNTVPVSPQPVNVTVPPDIDTPVPSTQPSTPRGPTPRPKPPFEPIFNSTYVVRKGQTLQQVATMFGISREQLAHANGLGTGAGLRTGQVLKVPKPAPGGKPNPAK